MKVEVQLINVKGRSIPTADRSCMPKYRGRLRIQEARSQAMGRIVNMSDLLSVTGGTDEAMLPSLHDASVIFLNKGVMRICGFEVIDGVQYRQTWHLLVS